MKRKVSRKAPVKKIIKAKAKPKAKTKKTVKASVAVIEVAYPQQGEAKVIEEAVAVAAGAPCDSGAPCCEGGVEPGSAEAKEIRAGNIPFLRQAVRRSGKDVTAQEEWEKSGVVGVDAGMIWLGDPCYFINNNGSAPEYMKDWSKFCENLDGDATQHNYAKGHAGLGVTVSSGYGDGCYPVFIKRDPVTKRVAEVKVVFIDSEKPEFDESDLQPE